MRHAAGQARVNDYVAASHVEVALASLGEAARSTQCLLINRADNDDAHNAAAKASGRAALLQAGGLLAPSICFSDHIEST